MAKFKVGDRVRGVGTYDHKNIDGLLGTVKYVGPDWYAVHFDANIDGWGYPYGHGWGVDEKHLVAAESVNKIVITTDGKTTTARMFDGKQAVKSAEAKCHPNDEFNFETGARIAFQRLMGGVFFPLADKPELPQQETIKLYCVKDYAPNFMIKAGKVYIFSDGQIINYEDGIPGDTYEGYEDFASLNPDVAKCLVPLVKRPAKAGEWVLLDGETMPLQVIRICVNGCVVLSGERHTCHKEYLVLDGYQPEPEQPQYYSGKVVCIDTNHSDIFTCGKIYTISDGCMTADGGAILDCIKSVDELNSLSGDLFRHKFIPLVE